MFWGGISYEDLCDVLRMKIRKNGVLFGIVSFFLYLCIIINCNFL